MCGGFTTLQEDDDYGSASGSRSKSSSQKPVSKRPAPSGSSGPKRVIRDEDSDQDAEYTSSSARRSGGSGSRAIDIPLEDFERLVKDVVRLAIFTAHSDHALRRDDIREGTIWDIWRYLNMHTDTSLIPLGIVILTIVGTTVVNSS